MYCLKFLGFDCTNLSTSCFLGLTYAISHGFEIPRVRLYQSPNLMLPRFSTCNKSWCCLLIASISSQCFLPSAILLFRFFPCFLICAALCVALSLFYTVFSLFYTGLASFMKLVFKINSGVLRRCSFPVVFTLVPFAVLFRVSLRQQGLMFHICKISSNLTCLETIEVFNHFLRDLPKISIPGSTMPFQRF